MSSIAGHKRRPSDVNEHSASYPLKRPRYAPEGINAAPESTNTVDRKKLTTGDYTIGWVAALSIERAAALAMLDEVHQKLPKKTGDNNNYAFGRIGDHNIVIASLPDDGYGTINAATVAGNMHRTFPSLEVFLMVGIAGGAPGVSDVRLGDVVVSTKLIQYDLGKALGENRFETIAIPHRPAQHLRTAVGALKAQHEMEPSKIPVILRRIAEQRPHMEEYTCRETLKDLLFESAYEHPESESACDRCDHSRLVKRAPRRNNDPVIHYGVIASGDQVIKYATTRDKLAHQFKALCFEMEGAGFIESLQCLVIRSICDYADSHKNKEWQRYAAATAAAYTKELLGEMPILETQALQIVEEVEELPPARKTDLMKSLSFPSMYSREWNIQSAKYKTCEWILQHPVYLTWLDLDRYSQSQGFLWIRGKPGAGKSTLMKFISTRLLENHPTVVSFFFNARGDDLEKSVEGMYRSLLHQLLKNLPDLQLLDHPHLHFLASGSHLEWTIGFLQELFSTAIARLGQQELICIVDALDECNVSQVTGMVQHFERLGALALEKKLKLFICFSSRHYPEISIENGLTLVLENQNGHAKDLEEYVEREFCVGKGKDTIEIRTMLLRKAAGVFLWIVLVIRILNKDCAGGRMFGLKARLDKIPSELHDLFKDILMKDSDDRADLLLSIQWILYANGPLSPEEYYHAMAAGLDPEGRYLVGWDREKVTIEQMKHFVSSSSKGLAEVTVWTPYNTRVQFIHESVNDFLLKDGGIHMLWPDFGKSFQSRSHDQLKDCCYVYLKGASSVMERYKGPDFRFDDFKEGFPFLTYATNYVLHHADRAIGVPQQEFLRTFDLQVWIKLHNMLIKLDIIGRSLEDIYTPSANIIYILANECYPQLINSVSATHGPTIHVHGEYWQYPLFAALHTRNREVIDAILRAGVFLREENSIVSQLPPNCETIQLHDHTPMSLAIKARHAGAVQLLLDQGLSPNTTKPDGMNMLSYAAEVGDDRIARLLLDRGVEVNIKDERGKTPLFFAASPEIAKLLLSNGAEVNARDKYSVTPLFSADLYEFPETMKVLLDRGAEVNARDENGETPLFSTVECRSPEATKLLVDRGADINARDENCETPLFFAARCGYLENIKVLLDRGADINAKDKNGKTPLFSAAKYRSLEAIKALLDRGADIHARDKHGRTVLFTAIETTKYLMKGHISNVPEIIQLLLDNGAEVNLRFKDSETPLGYAIRLGSKDVVKLLLARGASINMANTKWHTFFDTEKLHTFSEPILTRL
ncbi:ankyrin repeat-containing domain protein [Xylaria telfairii]|nr:ankyrin repeat-containing domain protein [Xylaria telfairii]